MNMSEMFLDTTSRGIKRCMDKLIGKVILAKPVIDKLKISSIIEKVTKETSANHEKIGNGDVGAIMVLNRLAAPMPMCNIEKWVDEDTCVGNIYGLDLGVMNDDRIGNFLDEIHPYIQVLWSEIISTAISEYDIPFKIIYNDITSSYFEGTYAESDIAKFGYSRDQKSDKKQINIDIDANESGIPLVYKILSGETSDKSTVIDNMEDIIKSLENSKLKGKIPLVVGDRAMQNNKIIVAYHKRKDLDYLGTLQSTKKLNELISSVKDEKYKLIDTENDNGLYSGYLTEWTFTDKGYSITDKILLVRSEQKLLNDRKQRKRVIDNFIEVLDDLKSKLNAHKYKELRNVEERIETLRKKYKGSKYVNTTATVDELGKISLEYSINQDLISEEMIIDGKYILATSRNDLSPKEMLGIYKGRDISEKDFTILKGPLQIHPIWLKKDERIESLVFIIMCALLVYSIIKMEIAQKELGISINKVMDEFKYFNVRYYEFVDGSKLRITGNLRELQESIITNLEYPLPSEYINSLL